MRVSVSETGTSTTPPPAPAVMCEVGVGANILDMKMVKQQTELVQQLEAEVRLNQAQKNCTKHYRLLNLLKHETTNVQNKDILHNIYYAPKENTTTNPPAQPHDPPLPSHAFTAPPVSIRGRAGGTRSGRTATRGARSGAENQPGPGGTAGGDGGEVGRAAAADTGGERAAGERDEAAEGGPDTSVQV